MERCIDVANTGNAFFPVGGEPAEPVRDVKIEKGMTVDALMVQLRQSGGFTGRKLAEAVDIMEEMVRKEGCTTFLSFPACIMATGTRGVIVELVKRGLVDAVITTCGTMDHDLARSWKKYYHGDFLTDDVKLHREGMNRLGNAPSAQYLIWRCPREETGANVQGHPEGP